MWLLIVPFVVLLVLVFSGMALLGAILSVFGAHWPWLLIGLGLWMFWREGRPRRRHAPAMVTPARRAGGPEPVAMKTSANATPSTSTSSPRPAGTAELPIDVQVKVEQIRRKVEVLLGYADRFPPFSKDLYLVRQTASDYLPRTIEAFLKLPEKPVNSDRASLLRELKTQLDLLDAKLDDIANDLQRQDMDRLLANRRFLELRFNRQTATTQFGAAAQSSSGGAAS